METVRRGLEKIARRKRKFLNGEWKHGKQVRDLMRRENRATGTFRKGWDP